MIYYYELVTSKKYVSLCAQEEELLKAYHADPTDENLEKVENIRFKIFSMQFGNNTGGN